MALRPFLASLFFARPFCQARFGAFRPISALRAAYGGCAPKRAFCEADVPEGARSDPSGLGAEMRPPERCERSFAPCDGRPGRCPWTCALRARGLRALNFTPIVTQPFTWVLPGDLTALCPKRKIAPHNLARGDFYLPPSTASDSRHNSSQRTTLRRGAPGRVWEGVRVGVGPSVKFPE